MKNKLILLLLILTQSIRLLGQCECYSVESIDIPKDTAGIMRIGFMNRCDDRVYLRSWVFNEKNDTIATFIDCWCGAVLPFNKTVFWDFTTNLTQLPEIKDLRIAFGYDEPDLCPEIKINSSLLITQNYKGKESPIVYPNPSHGRMYLDFKQAVSSIEIFRLNGVKENNFLLHDQFIDVQDLKAGIYMIRMIMENGETFFNKIIIK
ncbi:MAG: T9SS type A sorting domain-containing protein [Saprospiraceae bacterium]|nr:T9SS type A sorting domain-containing protein [Saprospiraceae bacterium]